MSEPLIECVPNFSEGRDRTVIQAIADAVESVETVKLLNVDPGKSTNRTVYTFAGPPDDVCEAAFRAAKVGTERIDMTRHHGEHPRFGALDVCPLVPISGISMEEVVNLARKLAKRLGEELGLTVYLYGYAATSEARRELANIRSGQYEGLAKKLEDPEWKPDFGPATFNPKSGATAVGARDFLVAFNVNLNTTSVRRANAVAFDVRERGRVKRIGDPLTGEIMRDEKGEPVYEPGALKSVKAIGWYIEEYGFAQVSMNLTNLGETPLHVAFDACCEKAAARGMRVTGSELVGLVPLKAMLDAGRYFLRKQKRSSGVPEAELIRVAIRSMGLDELARFDPQERIIEYAMRKGEKQGLIGLSTRAFVEKVASEAPAPGGGSVAALVGALGAALGTMVANLSSHKRGWDDRWEEFSNWAEKGQACADRLLRLVDEDTAAFEALLEAYGLPRSTEEERSARSEAIARATRRAAEVPLDTMRAALEALPVIKAMAEVGNPNSASDAGVGALCARAAIRAARLNVETNLAGLDDDAFVAHALAETVRIEAAAEAIESEALEVVEAKLKSR